LGDSAPYSGARVDLRHVRVVRPLDGLDHLACLSEVRVRRVEVQAGGGGGGAAAALDRGGGGGGGGDGSGARRVVVLSRLSTRAA